MTLKYWKMMSVSTNSVLFFERGKFNNFISSKWYEPFIKFCRPLVDVIDCDIALPKWLPEIFTLVIAISPFGRSTFRASGYQNLWATKICLVPVALELFIKQDIQILCQPQSVFFPLIKVSPQFLIKGISSLKLLILRLYSLFNSL